MTPCILLIAGGTGAGKSRLAGRLAATLGPDTVTILNADDYYRDLSDLTEPERHLLNFDHPDALDWPLLCQHLAALRAGRAIDRPVYDFTCHCRTGHCLHIPPTPLIVAEGILLLSRPDVCALGAVRVFIDVPADIRLARRLQRDISERGRNADSVIEQYLRSVRPMHAQFVEPSRKNAHLVLHSADDTTPVLQRVRAVMAHRS